MDSLTAVTALSHVVLEGDQTCDPGPFLIERKSKKYLGLQDALAVVCAGRALATAGFGARPPAERTGVYLAVGFIPFLERDVAPVLEGSLDAAGELSLARFAADGYTRAHPLLAFRCLPNMPAYHVAANFGIEGPYSVLYPGAGELYLALEEASAALERGDVDVALVVGVAHQRNFLVEHHARRLSPPIDVGSLRDAGAAAVLERSADARARGATVVAELVDVDVTYTPFDALSTVPLRDETVERMGGRAAHAELSLELGPASPLVAVARALEDGATDVVHHLRSRNGIAGRSRWRRPS